MKQDFSISFYLDTRRKKISNKFPVKLRVYSSNSQDRKLYSTVFELTKKEYESAWETIKPRSEYKELRNKMTALVVNANEVASKISPFEHDVFERRMFRKAGAGNLLCYHYENQIQELISRQQISTADTYSLSQKSIQEYCKSHLNRDCSKLGFHEVTISWLKDYEYYMTEVKGRSFTTVSIYLRVLRAIFNMAIEKKDIEDSCYPFGKKKYQLPSVSNVKKVLSKEELLVLFNSVPKTTEQVKAKDFWFFSFVCNGMNMKDIALLKYKHIDKKENKIEFIRAKTRMTSKANQKPITVYLNDFAKTVIGKYSNKKPLPDNYVFDIIEEGLTAKEQQNKIKAFTRFVNQHLKKHCKEIGLPSDISTYWARHSFATTAVRKGASMEFVQESLGHGNLKTTQNYFAGFDNDAKKEFAKDILDFT